MYEYAPLLTKRKERMIAILLLFLGLGLFGFSRIPGIPIPVIYQALGMLCLVATVGLVSRYLTRRYTYRVEPRDDGVEDNVPDLVITEHYARRVLVVCRISVADIVEILPITDENQAEIKEKRGKQSFYDYTADLFSQNRYFLTVSDGEHHFCMRILADEELLKWLQKA